MKVNRTGQRPLVFNGTLLASASSHKHAGKERNRWHEIQVHRTESGKFIVSVCYRTQWKGEANYDDAVIFDAVEQVATFLEKYVSPNIRKIGYPARPEFSERQARLLAELDDGFKRAAGAVLDQLDCVEPV